ncbi:sigma-70 family RNA polymerase sigma factor [Chitinophagaceae bacterium LB-8]|uniref:Sigma-70 family RNA polymerase sigma factor n=1 Tax=Paraflavisolibacter caeni TaxID=2982496 RepID=A0A9X3BHL0_9BACT|nr:sigma-70 family RNA polymerase sigma factor [Paraflavisolibacter caeni]MCU7552504.1 sigma-70 family RNA polymerase sigma factor [Paraflavisolibacter caeni]
MKSGRFDHITDTQLLDLFYSDKDQKWIGILLERYTLLLFGLCMKYLKDEVEARDCVQQIFLKVLTELPKYKVDYFKSWLYMVAKNQCLMKLRGKSVKEFKELTEHLAVEENFNKEAILENELTFQFLEEALIELNEEQRLCVTLFYLQKESYLQISERTGYSLLQVKSYIQNGKRNLKLLLLKKLNANKAN